MATYKILGQVATTTADAWQSVYTVGSGTSAVVSTLVLCGIGAGSTTLSVKVLAASADPTNANTNKAYIFKDFQVGSGESHTFTLGITLATGESLAVKCGGSAGAGLSVAVNAFGMEV